MKFLLALLLGYALHAQSSCYTVQLVSRFASETNRETLSKESYDVSCKLMEIGKTLTVRCGCYEKVKDAKEVLPKYQKEHSSAYVTTTYKSRFDQAQVKMDAPIAPIIVDAPKEAHIAPVVAVASVKKIEPAIVATEVVSVFANETIGENILPQKELVVTPQNVVDVKETQNKTEAKKEKKKKSKKKKKEKAQLKYVKKQNETYDYHRYLKKLESKKGIGLFDYRYKFGAQLSYDLAYVDQANLSYGAHDWRRIRFYHKGSFFDEKLFYEFEYSYTGANKYKDVLLGYQGSLEFLEGDYRFKFGNIKVPFSLEGYSSSKNITFMERALNDAYGDSRKVSIELLLGKDFDESRVNWFGSFYTNSIDERIKNSVNQPGYASRITYAYKVRKNHLLALGTAFAKQNMQGENVKFNQTSESNWMNEKYVKAKVKNVASERKKNFEALYVYDKYSLQGEYSSVALSALKNNYNFEGVYLQGSYFLLGTGRKYNFDDSTLGKIKPYQGGALELAFRYSYINLSDKDEQNGEQTDYGFGLNWYLNNEIRFFLNYTVARPTGNGEYDGQLQIIQSRVLFAF